MACLGFLAEEFWRRAPHLLDATLVAPGSSPSPSTPRAPDVPPGCWDRRHRRHSPSNGGTTQCRRNELCACGSDP